MTRQVILVVYYDFLLTDCGQINISMRYNDIYIYIYMYYCSLSDVMFKRTLMHTIAIAAYTPCFVATALVKMSDGGKKN